MTIHSIFDSGPGVPLEQIDLVISGIVGYLLIAAGFVRWVGSRVSSVHQHQFAFVTIFLLIVGIIPQLSLPLVAPGIIFSLGMMLFALHLSAYYSGTPKNSASLYAVILSLS
ncbi:MAG: hypothetical protein L3J79_11975, partial [Candidatus Marinimicrobia bacterium]|nr:hypothetical protein [Candidatus Neomarinimicrobiota bacterium]